MTEGLKEAENRIKRDFLNNASNELEEILSITCLTSIELEDSYEYCFIVKSYESFGIYKE